MNIVLNKYATALLQFGLTLVVAVQASLTGGLDLVEVWQLAALVVANVGTYFVPLVDGRFVGLAKTGVAVIGAAVTAIIPLVYNEWTAETVIIVVLAVLNAFAAQAGVAIRMDSSAGSIAAPEVSNAVPVAVDEKAAEINAPGVTDSVPVEKLGQ